MAKRSKKEEQESTETDQQEPTNGDKKRILLVDDDPEIVETLRYALEARGYGVLIARDGNRVNPTATRLRSSDLAAIHLSIAPHWKAHCRTCPTGSSSPCSPGPATGSKRR